VVLRFVLWRLLGALALVAAFALASWLLSGGPGRALRTGGRGELHATVLLDEIASVPSSLWDARSLLERPAGAIVSLLACGAGASLAVARAHARRRRRYVRLRIDAYRADHAESAALTEMFAALHKRLLRRWWRRLLAGQPSLSLEVHHGGGGAYAAWFALSCPAGCERLVEAAMQVAYPNCRLRPIERELGVPPVVLRLKKRAEFIKRVKSVAYRERRAQAPVDRLLTAMAACGEPAFVQIAMTPTPALFEALARHVYKRHEARLSRERSEHVVRRDRSLIDEVELRGGLELQHRPLFFADVRVVARRRATCERIASELRADSAENHLVERGTAIRHGLLGLYSRRVRRGEGNALPSFRKGVYAAGELAAMWQLPSSDYLTVPFARSALPRAPAAPAILRAAEGGGVLRDALGPVSIHVEMRRQNTAVPGTVEQGKSSYLVASVAEDLRRERCAVIVLDPKGDAAEAALSAVPCERACTLLDLARPTCGFNPLAVDAPADVIADYVVGALKSLFTDADIRASSDRYLRNAIIAVLAYDRSCTLWDAARLLSVGEDGYAYRRHVGAAVRALPEFKEISEFFTAELSAQLADARSTTTAKLDAPVNKLARLLNSPSIKRVLLNDSLTVDFERVIAGAEVLIVKGALGAMGAGNTAVLMQLLVGMLDAALARQQDLVPMAERTAVALKVDEAPLVINRGFAETMALKRSAGLETVACWQTDAQWVEREVREQLDALFAHRVYFATASVADARDAARLAMAEFSDTVRPGIERLSSLGRPDVRLHLPRHHAVVSWVTPEGRQPPFVAETLPMGVDGERLALHAARQHARGGRHLVDLRQPHWDRARDGRELTSGRPHAPAPPPPAPSSAPAARPCAPPPPPAAPAAPPCAPPSPSPAEPSPAEPSPVAPSADRPARGAPAESYRELVALDGAHSVRWARRSGPPRTLDPDELDIAMLELIAAAGHALTSQLHRRFNPRRAPTTTQRRLKRLSDAGLVDRFQFHRRDGGGIPMCYALAPAGARLLAERGHRGELGARADGESHAGTRAGAADLRQARHDVHVAGWALALAAALSGRASTALRGARESTLAPPGRRGAEGWTALGPSDLRLPAGRVAHDFVRSGDGGETVEVERFETLRPDATVEVSPSARARSGAGAVAHAEPRSRTDVIVELDDRPAVGRAARKLERYDHFLAGWALHVPRYANGGASALVVFVCRDRARARECARRADLALRACRAYAGEYPLDWEYPSRERVLFAAERDVHEGLLVAYGVPRVPPAVRVSAAHGDPRAGEASAEPRDLAALLTGEDAGPESPS
jgi:Replication-relaxation